LYIDSFLGEDMKLSIILVAIVLMVGANGHIQEYWSQLQAQQQHQQPQQQQAEVALQLNVGTSKSKPFTSVNAPIQVPLPTIVFTI
jgi:hypothetical protein